MIESQHPQRVFVVDDHPLVCTLLAGLIDNDPQLTWAGECATPATALTAISQTQPHLVIVDISLEEGSGLDLIKQLHSQLPHIKILVFTAHSASGYAARIRDLGANGFINKRQSPQQLIEAIHAVLAGERVFPELIDNESTSNRLAELTNRELQILELIAEGLTNQAMAQQLSLSVKTIENHRENIKRKLHLENANALVRYALHWSMENH